jgi:hypothetical protein
MSHPSCLVSATLYESLGIFDYLVIYDVLWLLVRSLFIGSSMTYGTIFDCMRHRIASFNSITYFILSAESL